MRPYGITIFPHPKYEEYCKLRRLPLDRTYPTVLPSASGLLTNSLCHFRADMLTVQELRQICLLAAAGGLVRRNRAGQGRSLRKTHHSMRCVLYMLVAFSLRRRNLGRRDLRSVTENPNSPNSARLRFSNCGATAFRSRMRARLSSIHPILFHKQGCLAITYM